MRSFIFLMFLAIALSISTTILTLRLTSFDIAKPHHKREIHHTLTKFINETPPLAELNLTILYPKQTLYQLLPMASGINSNEDSVPFTNKTNCEKYYLPENKSLNYNLLLSTLSDKEEVLNLFLCRVIKTIPDEFIKTPPFISQNGKSFAYRLYNSQFEVFHNSDWIKNQISYFSIDELKEIPNEHLDTPFHYIKEIDPKLILELLGNTKYIITNKFFISKDLINSNLRFYSLDRLEDHFQEKNYMLKPMAMGAKCFFQVSNLCLDRTAGFANEIFSYPFYFVISLSIIILLVIFVLTFKKFKTEALENEQKRTAFRILTHELRTPVTNMVLLNGEAQKILNETSIPLESLENIQLKMENEIYRLKRLAEKSSNYLNATEKGNRLKLNLTPISNFSEYIIDLVNEHYPTSDFEFSEGFSKSHAVTIDPYWFQIIFKNLIDNAQKYGKGKIKLNIECKNSKLAISIGDQGIFPYKNLNEAIKNATPSDKGLGIGLSIVKTIVESMQGSLELINSPTTFIIWLKTCNESENYGKQNFDH